MEKRLTKQEQLARDICWAEFGGNSNNARKVAGCSKKEYWAKVANEPKSEYMRDARFLMNILPRLPYLTVLAIIKQGEILRHRH